MKLFRRSYMKQQEIKQLYAMMFPDYPDIVNVAQLQ